MRDPLPGPAHLDATGHLRTLIQRLRMSTASEETMAAVAEHLRAASDLLADSLHPGPYQQAGFFSGDMDPTLGRSIEDPHAFFPFSPIIGDHNALAPPVALRVTDDGEVTGEMTLGPAYCGPPGSVHGGVIALVYDELLGVCNVAGGMGGFTGTLTIVYRRTTPIGERITMRARLTGHEGRKTFVTGEMFHGDVLLSTAEGIFVRPKVSPFEAAR